MTFKERCHYLVHTHQAKDLSDASLIITRRTIRETQKLLRVVLSHAHSIR